MQRLARMANESRADVFLTTEKDDVKLSGDLRKALERVAPLGVCQLGVVLVDEVEAISGLIGQLGLD
jgi:tetraacyldisaccharide-1-P 4'-kinase